MAMYHEEPGQEGFLVLRGECLLVVEGEERPLRAWDFFHCPSHTKHVIIGAGREPALVLAVGARKGVASYPVDATAMRHGAGVDRGDFLQPRHTRSSPSPSKGLRRNWLKARPNATLLVDQLVDIVAQAAPKVVLDLERPYYPRRAGLSMLCMKPRWAR